MAWHRTGPFTGNDVRSAISRASGTTRPMHGWRAPVTELPPSAINQAFKRFLATAWQHRSTETNLFAGSFFFSAASRNPVALVRKTHEEDSGRSSQRLWDSRMILSRRRRNESDRDRSRKSTKSRTFIFLLLIKYTEVQIIAKSHGSYIHI